MIFLSTPCDCLSLFPSPSSSDDKESSHVHISSKHTLHSLEQFVCPLLFTSFFRRLFYSESHVLSFSHKNSTKIYRVRGGKRKELMLLHRNGKPFVSLRTDSSFHFLYFTASCRLRRKWNPSSRKLGTSRFIGHLFTHVEIESGDRTVRCDPTCEFRMPAGCL